MYLIATFTVGLLVGGFLTIYIPRVPKDLVELHGKSRCPTCQVDLLWWDCIPVISYFLLKRRCMRIPEQSCHLFRAEGCHPFRSQGCHAFRRKVATPLKEAGSRDSQGLSKAPDCVTFRIRS